MPASELQYSSARWLVQGGSSWVVDGYGVEIGQLRAASWWIQGDFWVVSGYEVEIDQLRAASSAAGSAAGQAGAVTRAAAWVRSRWPLPGGDAARSAPTLESTFNERATGWAGEIDRWSEPVSSSANTYPR